MGREEGGRRATGSVREKGKRGSRGGGADSSAIGVSAAAPAAAPSGACGGAGGKARGKESPCGPIAEAAAAIPNDGSV